MRTCWLPVLLLIAQFSDAAHAVPSGRSVYCGTRQWRPSIKVAANQFKVSSAWLEAILRVESAGCAYTNGLPTISSAGAMGLMQVMPVTWKRLQAELHLGQDPFDPHDNILAGAGYLRELYDQFGLPGAVAAYHSGPARYVQHLRTGRPLPNSTVDYVSRVLASINTELTDESLFVRRISGSGDGIRRRDVSALFNRSATVKFDRRAGLSPAQNLFINLKHPGMSSETSLSGTTDMPPDVSKQSEYPDEMPPGPEAR